MIQQEVDEALSRARASLGDWVNATLDPQRAARALGEILAIHQPLTWVDRDGGRVRRCFVCQGTWPCETALIIARNF